MADINVYFFWPGLVVSIVLSILFSVLLTIAFHLRTRKEALSDDSFSIDGARSYENDYGTNYENNTEPEHAEESKIKTSGVILIGPFSIVFENGKIGFDKSFFKYALSFFLIILIVWLLFI